MGGRGRGLARLCLGFVLGGVFATVVLWSHTGGQAWSAVVRRLSPPDGAARSTFGFDAEPVETGDLRPWGAVRSPRHPDWRVRRGLDVELVASGFTFPVSVLARKGAASGEPVLYVLELGGDVKAVGADGEVRTFAAGAVEFPAREARRHALSDEMGAVGLEQLPGGDLVVTGIYYDEPSGLLSNHVLRLRAAPDGWSATAKETLLDLREFTTPTHQIQSARVGPDGKLYVSVGDGHHPRLSLSLDRFGGKVLRMELDGSPCTDNPHYDPRTEGAPRNYVFARGLRNAFDLAFDPRTGALYAADDGTNMDRLLRIERGGAYAWDGRPESFRANALYLWSPPRPNPSPAGVAFVERDPLLVGTDRLLVALFGYGGAGGRSLVEFRVDADTGCVLGPPAPLVQYAGEEARTVLDVAEGEDGVYFTDFWGAGAEQPGTGSVWRIVRSEATADLPEELAEDEPGLAPVAHGRGVFLRDCAACHALDGVGGGEGPDLGRVAYELRGRLASPAYEARLERLLASEEGFYGAQRRALEAVRDAGAARVQVWLREHLREPRFDDKFARMPSFDLPPRDLDALIAFLSTLDSE